MNSIIKFSIVRKNGPMPPSETWFQYFRFLIYLMVSRIDTVGLHCQSMFRSVGRTRNCSSICDIAYAFLLPVSGLQYRFLAYHNRICHRLARHFAFVFTFTVAHIVSFRFENEIDDALTKPYKNAADSAVWV